MAGQRRSSRLDVDTAAFVRGLERAYQEIVFRSEREVYELGNDIANRAKQLCPVDTGILRSSIGVKGGVEGQQFVVYAGVLLEPSALPPGHLPPQEYAAYVEFGTKNMAPQPFMRPAIAEAVQARLGRDIGIPALLSGGRSRGRGRSKNGRFISVKRGIARTRLANLTGRRGLGRPSARASRAA